MSGVVEFVRVRVTDPGAIERLVGLLQKNREPMMFRQVASALEISLNTAAKYIEIAEARGFVEIKPFATAKLVALKEKGKTTSPRSSAA